MDADPYGLDILSVYKYGSRAMQHENEWMAAGRIRWLGLRASECRGELGIGRDGLLPLTKRDERKVCAKPGFLWKANPFERHESCC